MRVRITIEYDGGNYSGWQLQSGQDSIQARLEAALAQIFSQNVRVYGAGRTDAGVHARGQVAAFTLPREFDLVVLERALNALLPNDIAVRDIAFVDDGFDPRRTARSRVYEYRVLNRRIRSVFDFRYAWLIRDPLDIAAMNRTAAAFLGEHDFAAFRSLGSDEKTTVRRVYASEWRREAELLIYRVEATAFLRHMVRTMVAVMVAAGRGALKPQAVAQMLSNRNRGAVPASAPASGLFLLEVRY